MELSAFKTWNIAVKTGLCFERFDFDGIVWAVSFAYVAGYTGLCVYHSCFSISDLKQFITHMSTQMPHPLHFSKLTTG